ncbi:MAG: hypothetical protein AAF578_05955 [Pseudomonadota bacterium]
MNLLRMFFILLLLSFSSQLLADEDTEPSHRIIVNGEALSQEQVDGIVALYGSAQSGEYWYDAVSGLYGLDQGPPIGQLHPGLAIGGKLRASASGGGNGWTTGVFINGREIHTIEYLFYQSIFGQVLPGRFWMNAQGVGGYVGGPATFSVQDAMAQASRRAAGGNSGSSSVYLPGTGGRTGLHAGTASDGCTYVVAGNYSNDFC